MSPEVEALTKPDSQSAQGAPVQESRESQEPANVKQNDTKGEEPHNGPEPFQQGKQMHTKGKHAALATPAVRHLTKQLKLNIGDIPGSGKEGRVLKEDVRRHASSSTLADATIPSVFQSNPLEATPAQQEGKPLTPIQSQMFKTMSRSLSIPHFLYTDSVDFSTLNSIRRQLNANTDRSITDTTHSPSSPSAPPKLSALPFIIKAISLSLQSHPILNSHLDTTTDPTKPTLLTNPHHHIGLACDTPSGLLVPVIRHVETLSIASVAHEIARLSGLARAGKLASADLAGATFTVSNIGSIGGTAVAPVIVAPQVAILGIGRARAVPAFGNGGEIVRREECVFSWSADHRVVDGAVVARMAEVVRLCLEDVGGMLVRLR